MTTPRVRLGGRNELGVTNWVLSRVASRSVGVSTANLFATLGRTGGVFRGWLFYSATMMPFGPLDRRDTEMIIIRVAHVRECAYELDHHLRLGRRHGVTVEMADRIVQRPLFATGGSGSAQTTSVRSREDVVLDSVDELVTSGHLSDDNWHALLRHFDEAKIIGMLLLVGHYSALATVIAALRIERDPTP